MKELEHPGLPRIYDWFKQQEHTFLVMEYVEGMTLRQYLNKHGRVSERQAIEWAVELCGILAYLHSRHPAVIYRDLKPENIMIRQDGKLKLIDLGGTLRSACGREEGKWCVGTPGYAPPEQWKQTRGDERWDLYALVAVLHEMLTGVNPIRQPCGRRPVGEYDKALWGAMDEIIKRCTAENKKDAYQSMEQVECALRGYPTEQRKHLLVLRIKKMILALMGGYT
ncbi:MAG: serine/threonine protein kinase, partial [Lachnospiraceae bacterium]|nr:serine/threonine protein kinase [Lachnospiraceae bacterium]